MRYIFDKGEGDINSKSCLYRNCNFSMEYPKIVTSCVYIDENREQDSLLEVDIEKVMYRLDITEEEAYRYTKTVIESVFRLRNWEK